MKTLYMIIETTSDYENNYDTPVCVYDSEAMANMHAILANEWEKELKKKIESKELNYMNKIYHPYDLGKEYPYFSEYSVQEIQLRDTLPENKEK